MARMRKDGVSLRRNSHAHPSNRQVRELGDLNTRDIIKAFALGRHVNAETVIGFTYPASNVRDPRDETRPLLRNIIQSFESVMSWQACDQQWSVAFEARTESGFQ